MDAGSRCHDREIDLPPDNGFADPQDRLFALLDVLDELNG
jgi:hypothetical protein